MGCTRWVCGVRANRDPQMAARKRGRTMPLPKSVTVCECWARDGLQSVSRTVSTAEKIEMINRFVAAGFRKIEVTSFANPSRLPQFQDATEVLRSVEQRPDVSYVVMIPNEKGFDRFEDCLAKGGLAHEIILMISASEAHNVVNFGMDHDRAKKAHANIIRRAHDLGVKVIGCTGTVFGCPIQGDVPVDRVVEITRFYAEEGADTFMLGDTTGMANPLSVRQRIGRLRRLFPKIEFIAHFHDTRGNGVVNSIAALELGLRYVDTSIGAIGGQPASGARLYQDGYTGNTCTEDLVALLQEMGLETGIDLGRLIEIGGRAEEIIGHPLRSNVIRSGPVDHEPRDYCP